MRNPEFHQLSRQHPIEHNLFLIKHKTIEGVKKGLKVGSRFLLISSAISGGATALQAKDIQPAPSNLVSVPRTDLPLTYKENLAAAGLTLDSITEQAEILPPSVIRILSLETGLQSLYYADFQTNSQNPIVTQSINEVQGIFNGYTRALGLNISSYELVINGQLTANKTIEPTPTPYNKVNKIPVYVSVTGAGMLFIPDENSSLGWRAYSVGTTDIAE